MGNISAGASILRELFGDLWGCGDYYATSDSLPPEEEDHLLVKGHPWTSCGPFEEAGFVNISWRLNRDVLLDEQVFVPRGAEFFIRTSCKDSNFIRDDIQVESDYDVDAKRLTLDFMKP